MTMFTVLTVIGITGAWVAWRRRSPAETQYVSATWRASFLRERR